MGIEVLTGVKKRLELYFFREFKILAQAIQFVFLEVAGISNTERVPVDHLDLEDTIIDSIWF